MKKTHQKSDGSYGDERARLIAEKYYEYVQERLSQIEPSNGEPSNGEVLMDSLTVEERNEIYVKVTLSLFKIAFSSIILCISLKRVFNVFM